MKKSKIILLIVSLFIVFSLTSCELFIDEPKGRIIVIGTGLKYSKVDSNNDGEVDNLLTTSDELNKYGPLRGTLNDVKMFPAALNSLSELDGKELYFIPLTDEVESSSKNYATSDNIDNSINYLIDNSSISYKPLIIDNFDSYELDTILDTSFSGYSGDFTLNKNDILIFHYSGHGNDIGSLALMSNNNPNYVNELSLKTFYDYFAEVPCKTLILLDSCFSGNIVPESETTISTNDPRVDSKWFKDYFGFLFDSELSDSEKYEITSKNANPNVFVMAATTSAKESWENSETKANGYFTLAILESLGWNILKDDPISLGEFIESVPASINNCVSLDSIYEYTRNISHVISAYDPRVVGGRYDLVLFNL